MLSSAIGGGAVRSVEGGVSPSVSSSMEGVLPIRGVDGSTGEALPIGPATGLREASDPYRVDVVRWAALDVPSIMVEADLTKLREEYRIPSDIDLILPEPTERACFPRMGCTALHLNAFAFVWHGDAFGSVPNSVPAEEVAEKEGQGGGGRLVLLLSMGSHKPLVTGCPSSIKQWKESWFWVSGNWQRVVDDPEPDLDVPSVYGIASFLPRRELSRESIEVLWSIYQADSKSRSYSFILNRQRCLVELGLVASKAEMDQGRRPRPTLAKLAKQRPRTLVPGSAEDTSQRKAIEDLSRAGNKDVAGASNVIEVDDAPETESGEVVLEGPSRPTPILESGDGDPFDSKRRLRELIGAPGTRILDDALRSVPFYPSMGAQAMKKYFTPKWEEFSSHGELEDVLEASLASAIRASAMQMKVLGEFRTRMQEQKRRAAEASKADKEHQQALEGLRAALESAQAAYNQMEADLKESDSNLLNLTKQLDNANAAQRVAAEALEAANRDKRWLLEEAKSREEEIEGLRKELAAAEKGKKEAEDGKGEVEAKLANAEADFVANFHNTEAYSNFADYFARVGQQEVLAALRNDHPELDVKNLEARFPPPDAEGEEDSLDFSSL
ncbi:putative abhydrolase domain-containing protein [Abeliophyllum distichum]|uniref:Abhydrolase domain-containing protein n=1 Tax=Abeliophyllum distichum TaxID=126358 RepID=A0ABD1RTU2_9LAMI